MFQIAPSESTSFYGSDDRVQPLTGSGKPFGSAIAQTVSDSSQSVMEATSKYAAERARERAAEYGRDQANRAVNQLDIGMDEFIETYSKNIGNGLGDF